jgi:hypothetical protein
MDIENPQAKKYLEELHARTQGKEDIQVSMFDVGAAIGLERSEAGMIAEELIIEGLAELKSLSGGVGITPRGVAMVLGTGGGPVFAGSGLQLGSGPVLEDQGRQAVEKILMDIRGSVASNPRTFGQLEEIIVDIKTIETQMLSPNPKVAVIREVLRSLHKVLAELKVGSLTEQVNALVLS